MPPEGIAARYKALDNGHQATLGFLLPGDVDETEAFADRLDHGITAVTAVKTALVSRHAFDQLLAEFPELARGFRRLARLEQSVCRMWLANMGQRVADKQAAHLLCELRARFEAAGMGGPALSVGTVPCSSTVSPGNTVT